jgi:hypothetical protein
LHGADVFENRLFEGYSWLLATIGDTTLFVSDGKSSKDMILKVQKRTVEDNAFLYFVFKFNVIVAAL